jgi:hypothetical protein
VVSSVLAVVKKVNPFKVLKKHSEVLKEYLKNKFELKPEIELSDIEEEDKPELKPPEEQGEEEQSQSEEMTNI